MRMVVLSRAGSLYSTSRIVRAARARNHEVDLVDPLELQVVVKDGEPFLAHAGQPIPDYDVAIPRIGTSVTRHGMVTLRHLEDGGVIPLNGATALSTARDKIGSLAVLAAKGMPVPTTVCVRSSVGIEEALGLVGGPPAVIKLQAGTQGLGTILAESRNAVISTVETLLAMGQEVLLQTFVRQARGRDQRLFVVGGRVVAAMERRARRGEFRANLHRGGRGRPLTPDKATGRLAIGAAKALGLVVAGVDLLPTADGPLVLEVNSSPGLEGIEQVTEVDVARAIIRYAEKRVQRATKRGR